MRSFVKTRIAVASFGLTLTFFAISFGQARIIKPFDADWRFLKADAPNAQALDFNDSTWRKLDVPHDWSIEGPFGPKNPTGPAGGFLPAGIGWSPKLLYIYTQ